MKKRRQKEVAIGDRTLASEGPVRLVIFSQWHELLAESEVVGLDAGPLCTGASDHLLSSGGFT